MPEELLIRISVDFNTLTPDDKQVFVNKYVHKDLLEHIEPGTRVILYEEHEFEVEAIIAPVELETGEIHWYGTPDWSTQRDL